jgi:aryl-alcohol dehydrogenase-like predicted oxidoreductase
MKTRVLGRGGPAVSAIGLGCMRMSNMAGPPQPGAAADSESIATIEAALEAGITLLNTGDFYGMGHNESLIARAIKGRRDQAFVCVKCGALRDPSGRMFGMDGRPNAIKTFAAYSLQRLGVDHIDLYQPARNDPNVPYEETVGAIADLIQEGKVRYLGVSEIDSALLRRAHATHPVAALEIEYSLASRFIEQEILPTARDLGVGIVAYSVVTQGLLAGAMREGIQPGSVSAQFPRFQGDNLTHNLAKASALEQFAASKGLAPAQIAIAWVLSRGDDIVPLIGMSRRTRLPENLAALDVSLSEDDLSFLNECFAPGAIKGERYPTRPIGHATRRQSSHQ